MKCRICGSEQISTQWALGDSSYGDLFKNSKQEAMALPKQSLTVGTCDECGMLQLLETPDEFELYEGYTYQTKVTNNLDLFYKKLTEQVLSFYLQEDTSSGYILDIGSGDGSFLHIFKNLGWKTLGIEPSTILCNNSRARGIQTVNEFFQEGSGAKILEKYGYPSLISAHYVAANSNRPLEFFQEVSQLMGPNTVLSILTGYHLDQFAVNMFDYIGHDHVSYFSIKDLQLISRQVGLCLIDSQKYEHKGGSLHLILAQDSDAMRNQVSPNVFQLSQRELWVEQTGISSLGSLKERVRIESEKLQDYLRQNTTVKLYGIGASTSTTYLVNYLGLNDVLVGLFDDDPIKLGKFSPGSGIPVLCMSDLHSLKPDTLIILAWQHTNRIVQRLQDMNFTGQLLIPLPNFRILNL